jgi:predicted nucleic acid-binding protein
VEGDLVKVFLDSSVLINLLKDDENTKKKVLQYKDSYSFCTSTINIYEILKGFYLNERHQSIFKDKFNLMLSSITILDYDYNSADKAAMIYADLRKKGKPIKDTDHIIAGNALSNGVSTILTGNKKHFADINGLKVVEC